MSDRNATDENGINLVDTRPVWSAPTIAVAEISTLTQTSGFNTFDAPTSFGS